IISRRYRITSVYGQMHCEGSAGAQSALDGETSAMPVEHMLDQGEAQTGTPLRTAVGDVNAIKALREPGQGFWRNSRAVVAYRHACFRRAATRLSVRQCDIDALSGGTVLERIFDQVFERADQLIAVT